VTRRSETLNVALAASLGVLTAAGAYVIIPLPFSPVPVTAQTFFVLLAGLLLGARWGATAMVTYLIIGAAGFPVFSGGTGGIGILFGPTGGYLIGFVFSALVAGYIAQRAVGRAPKYRRGLFILAAIVGSAVIYVAGVSWLALAADFTLTEAVVVGLLPFVLGDVVKAAVAVLVSEYLWSTVSFMPIRSVKK
jgi:biotin transport system substrate-specific component